MRCLIDPGPLQGRSKAPGEMSHLPMGGQTELRDLLKLIFSAQKLTSTPYLLEVAQFRGGSSSFDGSEHRLSTLEVRVTARTGQ
jgi:hypothetical protein